MVIKIPENQKQGKGAVENPTHPPLCTRFPDVAQDPSCVSTGYGYYSTSSCDVTTSGCQVGGGDGQHNLIDQVVLLIQKTWGNNST